eukprot:TRINITY_DN168_c0_g2_i10.p1 TRINITY_DN168_c0_g2~~TRINITY_DN168_c0_g2_i10.p1  ORF type:complete len:372 (-),score=106.63 TRINITY_DN168_c0_g2_i10:81-1196(-)
MNINSNPLIALNTYSNHGPRTRKQWYQRRVRALPKAKDTAGKLAKYLAVDVQSVGLRKLLDFLSNDVLTSLSTGLDFPFITEDRKPTNKEMSKRICNELSSTGPKQFLLKHADVLPTILEELDTPTESNSSDNADVILTEAESMGLENCFSSFSAERLKQWAERSNLKVYGCNKDALIEALSTRTDIRKPVVKKKKAPPKLSSTQPKIEKGISVIDLNSWYYRDDLVNFCSKNGLTKTGTKAALIRRILNHFQGKDEVPKSAKAKSKTGRKTPKTKTKTKTDPNSTSKTTTETQSKTSKGTKELKEVSKDEAKEVSKKVSKEVREESEESREESREESYVSTERTEKVPEIQKKRKDPPPGKPKDQKKARK